MSGQANKKLQLSVQSANQPYGIRSGKMPEIGEIRKGTDAGKNDGSKYIWVVCSACGNQRWVQFRHGKPINNLCHACAMIQPEELERKRAKAPKGSRNINWRGGRRTHSQGYILIKLYPGDFFYPMADKTGYVLEHRLVVAKALGRCLHLWEIVHHKDHIKNHNEDSNLQLVSDDRHKQITILECKIDRQSQMIDELRKETRLLRWQIKELVGERKGTK